MIDRENGSKILNEEKSFKIINKNLQSFQEIKPSQAKVLPSRKLQDHAYQSQNRIFSD